MSDGIKVDDAADEGLVVNVSFEMLSKMGVENPDLLETLLQDEKYFTNFKWLGAGNPDIRHNVEAAERVDREGDESIVIYTKRSHYTVMHLRKEESGYTAKHAFDLNKKGDFDTPRFKPVEDKHLQDEQTQAQLLHPLYMLLYS